MQLYVLLVVVGLSGGFLAGWIGLGGGIILAPLLLFVPPAVGLSPLDMKEVARLTMIQSLFSTAAAGLAHRHAGNVHRQLVLWMGPTIATASLGGALLSELEMVSSKLLLGLFAALALLAAGLMCRQPPKENSDSTHHDPLPATGTEATGCHSSPAPFSRGYAVAVALGVGTLGGMVGQSGAFLTIPLLIHVLGIPVRLAIGSSLGITFCAALSGSVGKIAGGGAVRLSQVAALVCGSLAGSQIGAHASRLAPATLLKYALAILIGASAVRLWYQVLT